jgi:hypothetical protein
MTECCRQYDWFRQIAADRMLSTDSKCCWLAELCQQQNNKNKSCFTTCKIISSVKNFKTQVLEYFSPWVAKV